MLTFNLINETKNLIMKYTFLATLFLTPFLSFSQPGKQTLARNGYQLQYPTTWRIDTTGIMGAELFVFSPLTDTADKFSENVNLLIQDLKGQQIDLKAYKQISDEQFAQVTDGKVEESEIIKAGTKEYFRATYSMTQQNLQLKVTSICYIKNEKAYLVTYTALADTYEQYKKIAEEVLASFSFK